jgi:formate hydrogenlyase subunit 3/multisubunit Na+/H+ antiporter MnhD subunit
LLHVLNHSLFKSLLFFSAGSVYKQYHTRSIDSFGGVIKKMPKTTLFFLIGAIAICGLPPLNGFISEMLIYIGLFKGLLGGTFDNSILMLFGIISLVLIGGLAIFCFTKVFGVVFLGSPRKVKHENV